MHGRKTPYYLVLAALFAAAITVATAYILHIPLPTGGYIHLGDALIYLAGCLLPLPWAMAAAAIGAAAADLLTAPLWAAATLLIKALVVLPFTSRAGRILCRRNVLAVLIAGVFSPTAYGLAGCLLMGSPAAFLPQFAGTLVQAAGSGAVFLILGAALDRGRLKQRLGHS